MKAYVVDASTVVSAAQRVDGIPMQALVTIRNTGVIALSPNVYDEIAEVLGRRKFHKTIAPRLRLEILQLLSVAAVWFRPVIRVNECRDPCDDIYLELALASGAELIVTGDNDLLSLDPWRGVRILRAADALVWMADGATAYPPYIPK